MMPSRKKKQQTDWVTWVVLIALAVVVWGWLFGSGEQIQSGLDADKAGSIDVTRGDSTPPGCAHAQVQVQGQDK